jgi:5-enolpyruvylshikimate-3-phosphate synthase
MAFGVVGLTAAKGMTIVGAESADVSFPGFWQLLSSFT